MTEVRLPGHALCPGCGGAIAERIIYNTINETIGKDKVIHYGGGVCASGGMRNAELTSFGLHLSGQASGSTGISHALKVRNRTDIKVIEFGGDGGTCDIGFAKISGAAERNENMIHFTMDNEAYMNTGIQKSSQTPWGAWTTTTPIGRHDNYKKDMVMIMAYHFIPYVASASIAYPTDLKNKVKKALDMEGYRYIHVFAPCPTGWRHDSAKTVEIARLAVQSGMFNLVEVDNGNVKISVKPKERLPVAEYLGYQRRFRHLTEEQTKAIQKYSDNSWERLLSLDGTRIKPHTS
jgi:pyruvate/2-oxoacid:ferredoxin oxidoreductase beta subunit